LATAVSVISMTSPGLRGPRSVYKICIISPDLLNGHQCGIRQAVMPMP
jgi:hypothetical protein